MRGPHLHAAAQNRLERAGTGRPRPPREPAGITDQQVPCPISASGSEASDPRNATGTNRGPVVCSSPLMAGHTFPPVRMRDMACPLPASASSPQIQAPQTHHPGRRSPPRPAARARRRPAVGRGPAPYFGTDRPAGSMLSYTGGFFELLAGGGDGPEVADRITTDDLFAVQLLQVGVPTEVGLELPEGELGRAVAHHLAGPGGREHRGPGRGQAARPRLRCPGLAPTACPEGDGLVTVNKLLARKRPKLIPVYDWASTEGLELSSAAVRRAGRRAVRASGDSARRGRSPHLGRTAPGP